MRIAPIILTALLFVSAVHGQSSRGANSMAYEQDGIRIVASINAQIYQWEVTNVDADPIMFFSVQEHNTYNQNIPPGWEMHVEDGEFTAWTDDPTFAIRRGQTRMFDARSGSAGSMLGPVPAKLGFSARAEDVVFPVVWGPVPKHRGIVVLVAVTLIGLGVLHVALLRRFEKSEA